MPPMPEFGQPGLLNARNLIAGGIAVAVVVVAWLGLRSLSSDEPPPPPPPLPAPTEAVVEAVPEPEPIIEEPEEVEPPWPTVLVATQEIFAGDLLSADMVDWRMWRHEIDLNNALVKDEVSLDRVLGSVAKLPHQSRTPILRDRIVRPGFPGYITAALAPGHRAVPVQVDGATASARIIHPGDYVDLTLVFAQGAGNQSLSALGPVAQVIVSNVRVLAIGADLLRMRTNGMEGAMDSQPPEPPSGNIYTLEVTPRDADRIALAAATGQLRVTLRPTMALPEDLDQRTLVGLDEVMRPPNLPPDPRVEAAQVRIIRGPGRSDTVLVAAEEEPVEPSS